MWQGGHPSSPGQQGWHHHQQQYDEQEEPEWPPSRSSPRREKHLPPSSSSSRDKYPESWDPRSEMNHSPQLGSSQPTTTMSYIPSQYSSQAYPPPVHTTTIQTKSPGSTYFHPYHPKTRPLLFVNTVPPPPSSAGGKAALTPEALSQLKPKRKRITPEQLEALTGLFEQTDSPSFDVRESMGARLGMSNREVQVWFQNRRAKMNRMKVAQAQEEESKVAKASTPVASGSQSTFTSTYPPKRDVDKRASWPQASTRSSSSVTPPVKMETQISSFRIPNPQSSQPQHPHFYSIPSAFSPSASQRVPSSQTSSTVVSQGGQLRRGFAGPNIDIPSRSTQYSPNMTPLSPYRDTFASPTFPLPSPSLSSSYASTAFGTPSSPAFSSGSSYFSSSQADNMTSPYTPSSVSSPTGTFFRLSLESPSLYSPRSDAGFFSSDQSAGAQTPASSTSEPSSSLIRLAPINPSAGWSRPRPPPTNSSSEHVRPTHKRSYSDLGPAKESMKLPPLRGIVDSIAMDSNKRPSPPPETSSSAPTSPVDSHKADLQPSDSPPPVPLATSSSVPSTSGVPAPGSRLAASHSMRIHHFQRRAHHRPSSLSNILPRTEEEPMKGDATEGSDGQVPAEAATPLGLGMLAVASEFVEESDGKQVMFERARRMSYDVSAAAAMAVDSEENQ
ncbi:hypothetical protein T439DRAFT_320480 [Meredithblackwellia eburnea MCA 4105]